jgi:hypothetical protein
MFSLLGTVLHGIGVALDYGLAMIGWMRVEDPMTVSSHAGLALRANEGGILSALGKGLNWVDYPARRRGSTHTAEACTADIQRSINALAHLLDHAPAADVVVAKSLLANIKELA